LAGICYLHFGRIGGLGLQTWFAAYPQTPPARSTMAAEDYARRVLRLAAAGDAIS